MFIAPDHVYSSRSKKIRFAPSGAKRHASRIHVSLLRSSNNFGEFGFYKHFIPTG